MRIRTPTVLAAFALALSGAAVSPAHAAVSPAHAQQTKDNVAACVRGDWESTRVSVEHPVMDHVRIGGGGGVSLTIGDDGAATTNFSGMDRLTFSGKAHDTSVRGYVELHGEATGTVHTTETDENFGTIEANDVNWNDVTLTVVLTEPFDSRPLDGVPVNNLHQLAQKKAHAERATHALVLATSTYRCVNNRLVLTQTVQKRGHQARLTWTFERATG
jgi:hypothetical protein